MDDLKSIRTFGFRGEALASASMVARVGIVSRVRPRGKVVNDDVQQSDSSDEEEPQHNNCAYKMQYKDGAPNTQTNPNSKPKPSAGREGTVITVQDLFYNIPSRKRALDSGGRRSERDEYDRILNVVQRYAVHEAKRGVGFLCRGSNGSGGGGGKKKSGFGGAGNHTDLNTQSLNSVKRIQERRKRNRLSNMSTAVVNSTQQGQSTADEQLAATKDVIGHIYGAAVTRELLPLTTNEGDVEAVGYSALKAMVQEQDGASLDENATTDDSKSNQECDKSLEEKKTNSLLEEMMMGACDDQVKSNETSTVHDDKSATKPTSKFAFAYKATGLITNGSYSAPKSSSAFLLFINDRLVESSSIRRAVENVYADSLPKGGKPFIYLSLELPGPHVDVNVHPTKREVAFLHEDRLCDALSKVVRSVIGGATSSRTFNVANAGRLLPKEDKDDKSSRSEALMMKSHQQQQLKKAVTEDDDGSSSLEKNDNSSEQSKQPEKENSANMEQDELTSTAKEANNSTKKRSSTTDVKSTSSKRPYDPSRLVRTNRSLPVGALEPFLVEKEAKQSQSNVAASTSSTTVVKHKPGCPLANNPGQQQVDMSLPGAFASAICRCQVERSESLPPAPNNGIVVRNTPNITVPRQKKITPTHCEYESIIKLRNEVTNLNHQSLNETLRGSTYVGAVSRSRSLIQCGIDLLMINHRELAREMFYQICLLRFNGMSMAKLGGGGVDIMAAISQTLQFEEDLNSSSTSSASMDCNTKVTANKTNLNLARQATACLLEKAPMLEEYFSIKLEKVQVYNKEKQKVTSLRVTGLPILLDGHSPQPHGLPLFLLRLATEVDWSDEEPCFKGVCTELASFYSELPYAASTAMETNKDDDEDNDTNKTNIEFIDDEAKQYIKHTLFPAISYLLVPPKRFGGNSGAVVKLANLNSLYKVFERC